MIDNRVDNHKHDDKDAGHNHFGRDRNDGKRRKFKHGDKVRHFKYYRQDIASRHAHEKEYEVLDHAIETETGKTIVIYRSLANPEEVWARYAESFYSEVDATKYPNSVQQFRFELIEDEEETIDDRQTASTVNEGDNT